MELKNVKLVEKLAVETGTTKAGKNWKKQTIIVEETESQYPKQVAVTVWNDVVDKVESKNIGDIVNCAIKIESREYNNRWYTDVSAFAVHSAQPSAAPEAPKSSPSKKPEPVNDLPF